MQVIRPATDAYHRKRMAERVNEAKGIPSFYYALSHIWGLTENNRYYWNDISEYVNDEEGQPMEPVSMRPEKRDTLLRLLEDHPDSYWWIDVLCARSDTPLDIMGDIYSCCLECVALIDCEPSLIPQLHSMKSARDIFPCINWNHCKVAARDVLLRFRDLYLARYPQLYDTLRALMQSQWGKRVWTWQEMALPFGDVRLMAETGTHRRLSSTITLDELLINYRNVVQAITSMADVELLFSSKSYNYYH